MAGVAGAGVLDSMSAPARDARAETAQAVFAADDTSSRRGKRERGESPGWLNIALVLGTAIFAAVALLGIWWNLRAPYVDPAPQPPGGLAVTPFGAPMNAPPAAAPGAAAPAAAAAAAPGNAESEVSAALARAQALAAVDAAASGAAADVASASQPAPLTASAATAALTAAATAMPPAATRKDASDDMMQLLSRRGIGANTARPAANPDLPAHYDNNDIGPVAAEAQRQAAPAPVASAPSAASTVAAALAKCERYRWYEVIPKQRCVWAACNGRWGTDGCPAGGNRGESH
ncbi:hypothetical protein [Pandoraea bronchicola]|uniref:hypothetical protein n=1 Tax=Pandoraea bronchicola TaxID=2508287 RepID=UPI00123FFED1|nr:hypothetical protein [Pandoraea bronchicola]